MGRVAGVPGYVAVPFRISYRLVQRTAGGQLSCSMHMHDAGIGCLNLAFIKEFSSRRLKLFVHFVIDRIIALIRWKERS